MPESRQERDRLAKAKGVEFVTKADFLSDNKDAAAASVSSRTRPIRPSRKRRDQETGPQPPSRSRPGFERTPIQQQPKYDPPERRQDKYGNRPKLRRYAVQRRRN